MREKLDVWLRANLTILSNTSSLIGSTVVTSGLGFVYWWAAARLFPQESVGLASAGVSAMMLLGAVSVLGLGTLLITELPRQPQLAGSLISASLLTVGAVATGLGFAFTLLAPLISPELSPFSHSFFGAATYAVGVGVTAVTLVLDNALIGLLLGGLQFWRNLAFAVLKLAVLVGIGFLSAQTGVGIYASWVAGNVASLLVLAVLVGATGHRLLHPPQWRVLSRLGVPALKHHALNLAVQAPSLVLPLLVVAILSTDKNASFYTAWLLVSFSFMIPSHLSRVLHAVSAADASALAGKLRTTLQLSFYVGVLSCVFFLLTAHPLLSLFGEGYADQASSTLRVLALGVFANTIKSHYMTIARVEGRITVAAVVMAVAGALEVAAAAVGATVGGLMGLSIGLTAAFYVEALFLLPTVARAADITLFRGPKVQPGDQNA